MSDVMIPPKFWGMLSEAELKQWVMSGGRIEGRLLAKLSEALGRPDDPITEPFVVMFDSRDIERLFPVDGNAKFKNLRSANGKNYKGIRR